VTAVHRDCKVGRATEWTFEQLLTKDYLLRNQYEKLRVLFEKRNMNAGGTSTLIPSDRNGISCDMWRGTFDAHRCSASIHKDHGWGSRVLDERSKTKAGRDNRYLIEDFVDASAEHGQTLRHAMRRFGLLAHRTQHMTSATLFLLLGKKTPRSATA